jgi:pSer/pThr/pTyr-binding forkhead associated (FHA) protein
VKLEGGQLLVRDEGSNNGTYVGGQKIQPHVWTPVPPGGMIRFGPVEFSTRLE